MFHMAMISEIIKDMEYLESARGILFSGQSPLLAAQTMPRAWKSVGKTVHLQFPSHEQLYSEQLSNGSFFLKHGISHINSSKTTFMLY